MNKFEILFKFLLFCGFFFQTLNISLLFFDYGTVTKILIFTPDLFPTPDLAVCYNFADLIDLNWFNKRFGTNMRPRTTRTEAFKRRIQSQVTFEEVFKHTPHRTELVDRCSLRVPSSYGFEKYEKQFCDSLFDAKKFVQQEFICYQFSLKETFVYEFSVVSYTPQYSGMMYSIDLKSKYLKAAKSGKMFLLSSSGKVPYEASAFAPNFLVAPGDQLDIGYHWLTFSVLTNQKLPRPYNTNCVDYKSFMNVSSPIECFTNCVDTAARKYFGKGHFITITYSSHGVQGERMINADDIDDESTSKLLNYLEEECKERCSKPDCDQKYTITNVFSDPNNDNITIKYIVSSPQEPYITISTVEKMQLLEYLIFVLSCGSLWFGFHVLVLNPKKLVQKWTSKMEKKESKCSFCRETRRKLNQQVLESFTWGLTPTPET